MTKTGGTVCIGAGSEYGEGVHHGAPIVLDRKKGLRKSSSRAGLASRRAGSVMLRGVPGLLSTPPLDLADAARRLRELRARRRFAAALRAAADVGAGKLVSAHA